MSIWMKGLLMNQPCSSCIGALIINEFSCYSLDSRRRRRIARVKRKGKKTSACSQEDEKGERISNF